MGQREVWENIAKDWTEYRKVPPEEAAEFLSNKSGLILDLGCGSGRNFMQTDSKIIGIDFSKAMLFYARKNAKERGIDVSLAVSDASALPFKDNSFDAIIVFDVLHCIKYNKHKKVLKEIARVAKGKAPIMFSVWNKDQPKFKGAKKETFVPWKSRGKEYQRYCYLYSRDGFKALLKKFFSNIRVVGSREKAFGKYPKNLIGTGKAKK